MSAEPRPKRTKTPIVLLVIASLASLGILVIGGLALGGASLAYDSANDDLYRAVYLTECVKPTTTAESAACRKLEVRAKPVVIDGVEVRDKAVLLAGGTGTQAAGTALVAIFASLSALAIALISLGINVYTMLRSRPRGSK